jgi:hypothetical protein
MNQLKVKIKSVSHNAGFKFWYKMDDKFIVRQFTTSDFNEHAGVDRTKPEDYYIVIEGEFRNNIILMGDCEILSDGKEENVMTNKRLAELIMLELEDNHGIVDSFKHMEDTLCRFFNRNPSILSSAEPVESGSNIESLLSKQKKHQDYFDYDFDYSKKLIGTPLPGSSIIIKWKDYDEQDEGYLFSLPTVDEYLDDPIDIFFHVSKPFAGGDKDAPEQVYGHLGDLILNDACISVTVINSSPDLSPQSPPAAVAVDEKMIEEMAFKAYIIENRAAGFNQWYDENELRRNAYIKGAKAILDMGVVKEWIEYNKQKPPYEEQVLCLDVTDNNEISNSKREYYLATRSTTHHNHIFRDCTFWMPLPAAPIREGGDK